MRELPGPSQQRPVTRRSVEKNLPCNGRRLLASGAQAFSDQLTANGDACDTRARAWASQDLSRLDGLRENVAGPEGAHLESCRIWIVRRLAGWPHGLREPEWNEIFHVARFTQFWRKYS